MKTCRFRRTIAAALMGTALSGGSVWAQEILTAPLVSDEVGISVDSGYVSNTGDAPAVIWSTTIDVADALWLRLRYDHAQLSGDPEGGTGSYLLITSHLDGAYQTQNRIHVSQWQHTSAYFNGDAVDVELVAWPGTGENRIVMTSVTAGRESPPNRSICGPTDDRVLSDDPRAGRFMPIGCTAWLFDDANHTFLTAGHCDGGTVVEFNVPLSNSNGSVNHPPPEDQYAIDPASLQSNGGQGIGNDWAYFGCFQNSNTGLWPDQAQGDWYETKMPDPAQSQPTRITGYGVVSSPVDPRWSQVQKTHVGPLVTSSGSLVQYQTDTTGGNSGSPVIDDNVDMAFGIHTHGGCTSTSGENSGTGLNHTGLQNALDNPRGVCIPRGLEFLYPNGLPAMIDPDGGTSFLVEVHERGDHVPQPGTGMLYVNDGGGFASMSMTELTPNVYEAVFPPTECGAQVLFYLGAETTLGDLHTDPHNAPSSTYEALSADDVVVVASDDFETDTGWTVENTSLTTGAWVRAVPGNFGRSDPPSDYDGSGRCYVTGNTSAEDVDGGPTRLVSPAFDLTGLVAPKLSYARWFQTNGPTDYLDVEISEDGGLNWTLIERLGTQAGWDVQTVAISDYVSNLTAITRVRFSTWDNPNDSVTEAGVDRFQIVDVVCSCPADFNGDGVVDSRDFIDFLNAFVAQDPSADFNGDGVVNSQDFTAFLNAFVSGC